MQTRLGGWRLAAASGLFAVLVISSGCAGIGPRGAQAKVVDGNFVPSRPAAASYGPDATAVCPTNEMQRLVAAELERNRQGGKVAVSDGRLCALAEALLGWQGDAPPPESVIRFLSWHFGLPGQISPPILSQLDTDDDAQITPRLAEPITQYAGQAVQPRYGLAALRVSKGATGAERGKYASDTKVVVVLMDALVDLDAVPQTLPLNGQANLVGKLPDGVDNPQILICDAQGKLDAPKATPGKQFQSELKCGGKPGHAIVEIRGDTKRGLATLATFPVYCGTDPVPSSVALPVADATAADVGAQEKKIFDLINAERASGGLAPLAWDETVAKAARTISESERQSAANGAASLDPTAELKKLQFSSPVVLTNPSVARTAIEAQTLVSLSAKNRCNMLNDAITHGGVGVALAPPAKPTEQGSAYVTELLVRELPKVDVAKLREQLRAAIDQKRAAVNASVVRSNRQLEEIAQAYATAYATSEGSPAKEKVDDIVRPLYTAFRTVDIMAGNKPDPMETVEESGVVGKGNVIGVGVAQGGSANTVYVVIIVGSTK